MDTEKSTEIEDTLNYIQFEYSLLVFLLISTVCTAAYYSGGHRQSGQLQALIKVMMNGNKEKQLLNK